MKEYSTSDLKCVARRCGERAASIRAKYSTFPYNIAKTKMVDDELNYRIPSYRYMKFSEIVERGAFGIKDYGFTRVFIEDAKVYHALKLRVSIALKILSNRVERED